MAALLLAMVAAGCGGGSGDSGQTRETTLLPGGGTSNDVPSQPKPPEQQPPSEPQPEPEQPTDPGPTDPVPPSDPVPPVDPTPPVDPQVACPTLAECVDPGKAAIAKYKGNKKAAASYTFDDGYVSSFTIADLFEARGLRASFYVVPTTVEEGEWAQWKNLSQRGHEIGNHSMTHTIDLGLPETTDAQLETEITQAQAVITAKLGEKPLVFAFPWHSSTAAARTLALKTHFAIRTSTPALPFTLAFFDQEHGSPSVTLNTVNRQLADTVAEGGWYVAAGHGIDGDGWSPVSRQLLESHLDYARGFKQNLWTDTYLNVVRYQVCRKQAALEVIPNSSRQVQLRLTGNFAAECTQPLTVTIPTLVSGMPVLLARDANGTQLSLKKSGNALQVDILPGQAVILEAAQ